MYDQLKHLEKTILNIKKQHQLVCIELSRLKQQPAADPKEIAALKTQLDNSIAERDAAKKQVVELDKRYQNLAEAHHMIGEEQDKLHKQMTDLKQRHNNFEQHSNELQQQNKDLKQQIMDIQQQNRDLQEKNQLAAERTQVVLQRLTRIDQADS